MKKIFGLLLLLIIGFTSCEGRKTSRQALSESIEEFKKNVNLETHVYIPEAYIEHEVDSTLSNGFRVKIKTYSDMDNSVRFSKVKDTVNYQTHYRNFKFDIRVEKQGQLIYEETFDKLKVNKILGYRDDFTSSSPFYNFSALAVLKSVSLDEENSLNNTVYINFMYAVPETDRFAVHTFSINEDGSSNVILVKTN